MNSCLSDHFHHCRLRIRKTKLSRSFSPSLPSDAHICAYNTRNVPFVWWEIKMDTEGGRGEGGQEDMSTSHLGECSSRSIKAALLPPINTSTMNNPPQTRTCTHTRTRAHTYTPSCCGHQVKLTDLLSTWDSALQGNSKVHLFGIMHLKPFLSPVQSIISTVNLL